MDSDQILHRIQELHISLLPEFVEDDDEQTRSIDEYRLCYLENDVGKCIKATESYIATTATEPRELSPTELQELIAIRRNYIDLLPFAYDTADSREALVDYLLTQDSPLRSYAAESPIAQYLLLLQELQEATATES